ncbi:MAG: hypothetical protein WB471_16195 [Nocardioides sp.]
MTRRCFLHVGSPKTGTSYLQNVLWQSRDALATQGLELPLQRNDHFFLTLQLRGTYAPRVDPPRAADVLDRLEAALGRGTSDVLITHELLSVVPQEQVDAFLARLSDFEVHIIVTTRSLDRQLPSEWQQFVKTRHTGSYSTFLTQVRTRPGHRFWSGQDFAAIAARWGRSLPADQVHVVTVPPSGAPPDELLRRFCSVLGVDPAALDADVTRDNASLGYEQAELLRRVNQALGRRLRHHRTAYARVVKFWYAERVLAEQSGQRLVLPATEQSWCTEVSRDQATRIAAAGYDVVGDVADLMPVWAQSPVPDLTAEDSRLLEVSLEAMADMLVQRRRDLEVIRGLRRDLRRARGRSRSSTSSTSEAGRARQFLGRVRRSLSRAV